MPGKTLLSGTRFAAAALAIGLALCCPYRLSHAQQNPFGQLGEALKQKAAEKTVSTLLNNDLPLRLDANAVYPTAPAPPGGPFAPQPLSLTVADLDRPLPPGDYTLNVLAFCTEYSVHRPGAGVAYRLGPLQGKAASAIGDLLWRGTLEKNVQPRQLQAVSWAIQSGLHYDQMPRMYQSVIDNVIPEHRSQLNGDFIQSLETPPIPPVPPTPVLSLLSSSHRGGNNGEFKGDHKNTKNYNVVTFYQTNPTVLRQKTPALLKCNGL